MSDVSDRGRAADLVRALGQGAAGTAAIWELLRPRRAGVGLPLPGGRARWERSNHAGAPVTLLEGVALVAGAGASLLASGRGARPVASAALVLVAGAAGAIDDLHPDAVRKGLSGHAEALRAGEVSTGALKVLLIGSGAVLSTALAGVGPRHQRGVCQVLPAAVLVAGSANLANLFDLRPGRALKVGLLTAAPLILAGSTTAATVAGAAAVLLPSDLRGASMLGDTGANPLGATLGLAAVIRCGSASRATLLALVLGLTLASERVSFSRVIEASPVLRRLDQWGRA